MLCMLLFVVCAALGAQAQAAAGFTKIGNVSTLSFTDTTCPNLSVCYYQVTALDSSGFESAPAACAATTLCLGGNIAVSLMPSSGIHTTALGWIASPSPSATYNVYRHIGPLPATGLTVVVN